MLFEYALHNDSDTIVHVDSVQNGKRCNCVCKHCGDTLIAKNNGKINTHHFSHATKEESRDCRMTQLHIAIQLYFSSLSEITFPINRIAIDETDIAVSDLTTEVKESVLEYRIGPYLADIYLVTDIGDVAIEVCVTHKCDEDKIQYYIDQQIDSIEYYFPLAEGNSISEWISLVRNNLVEYKWIYHSELEIKKIEYFKQIEEEKRNKKAEKRNRALASLRKAISSKRIHLPSIHKEVECTYAEQSYKERPLIYSKRDLICDKVLLCHESSDYAVIEGYIDNRVISIIYSFTEEIPTLNYQDDRSIVCRHYSDESNASTWTWVKHPSLTKKFDKIKSQFRSDCEHIYHKRVRSVCLKDKVTKLASEYLDNRQVYFNRDYQKWRSWMMNKELFIPDQNKKNPSLPDILKKREYRMLWPFQAWSIIVLSHLAEMVDAYPVSQKIYYNDLFIKLAGKYGLSEQYRYLSKEFKDLNISTTTFDSLIDEDSTIKDALSTFGSLIDEDSMIKDALYPFAKMSIISVNKEHLMRKGSLILALGI
ncbi:hypothetical protein J8V57_12825 [Xenorhabdus sp. PB61.4]|uniref:hypothetical protein n=1 Tax=Xenorhabdus sp. PB61.4 TaxID=2788940 RepID=UPI001E4CBE89|nr:hypothetical protein [Xenorhabdus sp. PB61.4]MCC8367147.1 hypothetical protein [Xenorhabdus sp. PB61.4]